MSGGWRHFSWRGSVALAAVCLPLWAAPAVAQEEPAPEVVCPEAVPASAADLQRVAQTRRVLSGVHALATGHGVTVAVIDTGVSPHPRLARLVAGADFTHSAGALSDCDGHGTIAAGIIAAQPSDDDGLVGVAPGAQVVSIKQSTAFGAREDAGNLATLSEAIAHALEHHPQVITMSLASCVSPQEAEAVSHSALAQVLRDAEHQGVTVVAAGGNVGGPCQQGQAVIPAHLPTVIGVSARKDSVAMEDYSMATAGPVVSAPGMVPVGLSPRTGQLARGMREPQGERGFIGTSFAAPFVAGTVALLYQQRPEITPQQVRQLLAESSDPITGAVDPLRVLSQPTPVAARNQLPHDGGLRPDPRSPLVPAGASKPLAAPSTTTSQQTTAARRLAVLGGAALLVFSTGWAARPHLRRLFARRTPRFRNRGHQRDK
ncbi:S8 family serine peptidase [Corynebacterium aquilae]|uniref:S8 family serine peptidase n=1 Tax=Corynebacterium aquilae TaxID=203263 RepID=UPI0012EEAC28|nr:S8 family serine peptidase [Corynebacterium aquilae]